MKILHITDLHSYKPFYQWVAEQAHHYDAICITGDLIAGAGHYAANESVEQQIAFIKQWSSTITTPLFLCSGNHDLDVEDELNFDPNDFSSAIDDEDGYHQSDAIDVAPSSNWLLNCKSHNVFTDGDIQTINHITIGVAAYQTEQLSRYAQCDILLHHEPPANTKTAIQDNTDWGSECLFEALNNKVISPQYVLCGHVHKPLKNLDNIHNTVIYNPGASFIAQEPKHNIITL